MRFAFLLALMLVAFFMLVRPDRPPADSGPPAPPETLETRLAGEMAGPGAIGMTPAQREYFFRQLRDLDTYLPAVLADSRDSMLIRWPERISTPLRVFVEPSSVDGYSPRIRRSVIDAFGRWQRVPEIPVDFVFTTNREGADVVVRFIRTFDVRRAGQADVVWRSDGWLLSGTLTLATFSNEGFQFPPEAVFTVALHEIGHLLGIGHSDDPRDVMYPTTGVHDLTARDRRTAMLLYSVNPGPLGSSRQGR